MDQLRIVDHREWWITYENRLKPDEHGIYAKHETATRAYAALKSARELDLGCIFECQEVLVHRTAEKLDW